MAVDLDALIGLQATSLARAGAGLRSSWPEQSAMDATQLGQFIDTHRYGVLATVTARQRPVARPVAYLILQRTLWLATVDGSRLRNVRQRPWISFAVSSGDGAEHRAMIIDGPSEEIAPPPNAVLNAWASRHGSIPEWADAWLQITPERFLTFTAR